MVFKCKMCGGDITPEENSNIGKCPYCKSTMTLPNLENEKIVNLYNRANYLRLGCDFDKAKEVYENILNLDNDQVEAHWGLLLCKYGVEYVDDPKTKLKIPTCHRTSDYSILNDNEYKIICKKSYGEALKLYQDEAKEIDRLQKEILAISVNESPYDVFICYKETDDKGERTHDSVIAQDIYDKLTESGHKVFFARITLEDKLGQEYEPYIYSALRSAKVMLVVGTKEEHFNAVWVKNEWSRYLEMMKEDKRKSLIPVYSKIDAYKLPEEFAMLQAQSMDKIGAIQDLARGVDKLVSDSKNKKATDVDVEKVKQAMDEATNLGNGKYEVVVMKDKLPTWYYVFVILSVLGIGMCKMLSLVGGNSFISIYNTQTLRSFGQPLYIIMYGKLILSFIFLAVIAVCIFLSHLFIFINRKKYRLSKLLMKIAIFFEILFLLSFAKYGLLPFDEWGPYLFISYIIELAFIFVNPKWHIDSSSKIVMDKEGKAKQQEKNDKLIQEFIEKESFKIKNKKKFIAILISAIVIILIYSSYVFYIVYPGFSTSVKRNEDVNQLQIVSTTQIYERPKNWISRTLILGYVQEDDYVEYLGETENYYEVKNGKGIKGRIDKAKAKLIYGKNDPLYGKPQSNERNTSVLQVKVLPETLRIRAKANRYADVKGVVYKDEIYTVLKTKSDGNYTWYKIETTYGVKGYISDRYIDNNWNTTMYLERLEPLG